MSERGLENLVRGVEGLRWEALPSPVRQHAKRIVADTVGVMLAGGRRSEIRALIADEGPLGFPLPAQAGRGAGGRATLLSPGLPGAEPSVAAFVNATAGTFLELDEGYRPTGHPGIHVVPAALAVGEILGSSGPQLIEAVVRGYEATARLFEAYALTHPMHPHGHFGAVGAAVAVAELSGEDAAEAAAVAATLPVLSVWQPCLEGATARNAYTGTAASLGVWSNRLSGAGFTGSRDAQEAAFGQLVGTLREEEPLEAGKADPVVPERPRLTRNYFKLHSACALTHAALDATLAARRELGEADPEEVESVSVETVSNNLKIAAPARPNDLSTRFSLPYAVAAGLVHGHTAPEAFAYEERVAKLASRVAVRAREDLDRRWPEAVPAEVTLRTSAGEIRRRVDNPRGHHANPASPQELEEKFLFLVDDPAAGRLYERLLAAEELDNVSGIFEALR